MDLLQGPLHLRELLVVQRSPWLVWWQLEAVGERIAERERIDR
jgi:hypothetical protein